MARMDSWPAARMPTGLNVLGCRRAAWPSRIGCWFAASLLAGCLDAPALEPAAAEPRNGASCAPSCEPARDAAVGDASSAGAHDAGMASEAGAAAADSGTAADAGTVRDASAVAHTGTIRDAGATADTGADSAASGATTTADSGLGPKGRPLGVADCYSAASSSHPATLRYLQVSTSGDFAARASVLDELKAAAEAHPEEEEFALLLGLGSLWRLAESYDLELINPLLVLDTLDTAERELERAYKLCPTDHRIPAWLGPLKAMIGNLLGDSARFEEGVAMLERAIPHYPDFLTFSRVLLYADRPTDDPEFVKTVPTIDTLADCAFKTFSPACTNTPRVPHNLEGGAIYAGDMHAKMQNREKALAIYTALKTLPDYKTWKYQDLLEERIHTLDERIAAAASASTSDDLESAWNGTAVCSLCHQTN
jgi:tetratricopeptide (TPR) repeat protein